MEKKHQEFLQQLDSGEIEEADIEEYLLQKVLSDPQRQFLTDNRLTVSLVLNGRYGPQQEAAVLDWMRSVNSALGGVLFTIEEAGRGSPEAAGRGARGSQGVRWTELRR